MSAEEDCALALLAARGNHAAYKSLVEKHWPGLVQSARGLGIPETDVDDVVQDTFIAAWAALESYDAARPFRAWLFAIGMNKMRDALRWRKVRGFLFGALDVHADEAPQIVDAAAGPEQQAIARQELQRVQAVLRRLDAPLREAIVLTGLVGLSQPEAAEVLGVSLKTVEGRVLRARARLRELL